MWGKPFPFSSWVSSRVRQGCILVPLLFNTCLDWIIGKVVHESFCRASAGNIKVTDLVHVDNPALLKEMLEVLLLAVKPSPWNLCLLCQNQGPIFWGLSGWWFSSYTLWGCHCLKFLHTMIVGSSGPYKSWLLVWVRSTWSTWSFYYLCRWTDLNHAWVLALLWVWSMDCSVESFGTK